jgi:hypothetical protein
MTAIKGEYANLKPVKTRKVWVLEVEIPEEEIQYVTEVLGFPKQGEQKWLGIALLDTRIISGSTNIKKPEVSREIKCAVMLCKDVQFMHYLEVNTEDEAREELCRRCGISSRNELKDNLEAKEKLKQLHYNFHEYKRWGTYD